MSCVGLVAVAVAVVGAIAIRRARLLLAAHNHFDETALDALEDIYCLVMSHAVQGLVVDRQYQVTCVEK